MYLSLYLLEKKAICTRNICLSFKNVSFNTSDLNFSLPLAAETLLPLDCPIS